MANDIIVIPHLSPRIIKILAPLTKISVQDLSNQIKDWEDEPANLSYPVLVSTSGKENLGGGVFVGITAELQNAVVMFEARTQSDASGMITSVGVNPATILIDDTATFITDGIIAGDTVLNYIDISVATILSVDSETQITHEPLDDGTNNFWIYGDDYKIWNKTQCEITGGNLVAVDNNGNDTSAFLPSAFTHVVRTSASSATIQALEIIDLVHRIESLRESHPRFGRIIYWDPVGGNDANLATDPSLSVKTFSRAHDIATADTGDVIFALSRSATGQSIISNEQMTITKDTVSVRGPGKNFIISTASLGPSISIQASNVEISNFAVTSSGLATNAIEIDGAFLGFALNNILIKDIEVQGANSKQHGITITEASEVSIDGIVIEDILRNGIEINNNVSRVNITNCEIEGSGKSGISIIGPNANDTIIENCTIGNNTKYGIDIGVSTSTTVVRATNTIFNNTSGSINEQIGSQKVSIEQEQKDKPIKDILFAIESQRQHHAGFGTTCYWDPSGGNDANNGIIPEKSVRSFRKAHELVSNNNNDVIMAIPGSNSGSTYTSEIITVSKNFVFLRGPGRNFVIRPLSDSGQLPYIYATGSFSVGQTLTQAVSGATATVINVFNDNDGTDLHLENIVGTFDATNTISTSSGTALPGGILIQGRNQITVTGNGVEISGIAFETQSALTTHSVRGNGDFLLVKNCWFDISPGKMGIRIDNSSFSAIEDNHFEHAMFHAIHLRDNIKNILVRGNFIDDSGEYGINIDDTDNYQFDIEISNNRIFNSQKFAINISPGADDTFVRKDNFFGNNVLGNIQDRGINTVLEIAQDQVEQFQGAVRIESINGISGTEFPAGTHGNAVNNPEDARVIADRVGLKKYIVEGTIVLSEDHVDWTFVGEHGSLNNIVDIYGFDVAESTFENIKIQGAIGGKGIVARNCMLDNVIDFSGHAIDSMILGSIAIGASLDYVILLNVSSGNASPIIVDTGSSRLIAGAGLSGNWIIDNMDAKGFPLTSISLEFSSGEITLNASNIGGSIELGGLANLTDNSGLAVTVDSTNLLQPANQGGGAAAWDEIFTDHQIANTFGKKLTDILKLKRTIP